jgi:hypothetical protein
MHVCVCPSVYLNLKPCVWMLLALSCESVNVYHVSCCKLGNMWSILVWVKCDHLNVNTYGCIFFMREYFFFVESIHVSMFLIMRVLMCMWKWISGSTWVYVFMNVCDWTCRNIHVIEWILVQVCTEWIYYGVPSYVYVFEYIYEHVPESIHVSMDVCRRASMWAWMFVGEHPCEHVPDCESASVHVKVNVWEHLSLCIHEHVWLNL